jgi:membrane protease YdiL (CAAX protease family)
VSGAERSPRRPRRLLAALRIGRVDPQRESLFDFKRVGFLPAWCQVALVAGLFVATVLLTNAEYRRKGTVFGFPGPAFNVLFAPIYEELVFRGWILSKLVRGHSNAVAIAVSSLLFGLLHLRNVYWLDPPALVRSMAFTGLVFGPLAGYVTLRARSAWPAVILHGLNNLGYYA